MNEQELKTWLQSEDPELRKAMVADIQRHVATLTNNKAAFYGYAVLPGDYRTQPNPASLVVAFNRVSDIAEANRGNNYYRYCVDEWSNYVRDGFELTNSLLQSRFDEFNRLHKLDPDRFQLDDFEIAYIQKIDRVVLEALLELKNNATFHDSIYLIIWYSNAEYEIILESARTLNQPDIYKKFAAEFA